MIRMLRHDAVIQVPAEKVSFYLRMGYVQLDPVPAPVVEKPKKKRWKKKNG